MNPMVDGWMGDDWFHNGAFRQQNMSYIYDQEATREPRDQVVDQSLRRLRHVHGSWISR
jgi:predicted acyl esterase